MDWRQLDTPQKAATCPRCGWSGTLRDSLLEAAGPHIKATCPECQTYLCFAKRRTDKPIEDGGYMPTLSPRFDTLSPGLNRKSHVRGLRSYR